MITTNFAEMFNPQKMNEYFTQNFSKNFGQNFDMSKFMNFDNMPQWWPDLKATNMNMNGIDYEALVTAQRKNFDAVAAANQTMMANMQTILQRQADIFRETMETASNLMQDAMATGTPEEKLTRQTQLAKSAYETATRNMQELADMVSTSQSECIKAINQRVTASFDDLKSAVQK
jgi:phasin family protein